MGQGDPSWSGYGLCIRSGIVLPGAVQAADRAPDIEIDYGMLPEWDATRSSGVYRVRSADLFEIAIPHLARFTCVARRRILVDPAPGADPDHIAAMIVATVLPVLLWARGEIVLHAAAFVLPGATRAIAVAGASGGGKSTALDRALALGAAQIGDDSVRIASVDGAMRVAGLAGGYFARTGIDTRVFRAAPSCRPGDCPLGALLVLTPDTVAPQRLTGLAAIEALLRQRHRPRIAALLGTEAALLPALAAFARSVPIIAVAPGQR